MMHVLCSGLPVYIVAAFIKRMAQLALTAPPAGCMLLLPCIYNLLQRHPTCKCMIHRQRKRVLDGSEGSDQSQAAVTGGASDTFIVDTDDPACANALGSSLWELEALKRHSYPPVAKFVKVFSADFTKPVSSTHYLSFCVPLWFLFNTKQFAVLPVFAGGNRSTISMTSPQIAIPVSSPTRLHACSSRYH